MASFGLTSRCCASPGIVTRGSRHDSAWLTLAFRVDPVEKVDLRDGVLAAHFEANGSDASRNGEAVPNPHELRADLRDVEPLAMQFQGDVDGRRIARICCVRASTHVGAILSGERPR